MIPEFAFTFWFNDNAVFENWYEQYSAGTKDKDSVNELTSVMAGAGK